MVNIICDNCKDKKIFIFIQACRTTTNPTAPKEPTMLKKKIKNVVLFFATEYGAKAYRSNDGGSYFLKYVSETILAECTRTDLITMFEMIKEKTINARAEKQKLKPQRPEYKHTLPEAKQYLLPYKFLKELENDFDVIKENYLQSLEEITVHDEKFACFIKSIFTGLSHIFCRYLIES
uniref:Peptidase C14 caspase domain-containing protein n=1 Tax=Panagrolaimus superbus TaxID=310955 RepID=A0A914YMN2_9BILA